MTVNEQTNKVAKYFIDKLNTMLEFDEDIEINSVDEIEKLINNYKVDKNDYLNNNKLNYENN